MRRWALALLTVVGVSPAMGQTVNGPGDDVLCSGYTAPRFLTVDQWRNRPDQKLPAPSSLPQPHHRPPYSFRQVSQELKTLPDGTRICGVPSVRVSYNDSFGRSRNEMNFAIAGPDGKPIPTLAKIDDPVAGTVYYLDLITQTAYRMHPPPLNPIPASGRPLPQNPAITGKNQNLGARSFEGLAVEGNLYTLTGTPPGASEPFSTTSETWVYRFANGEWPTTLLTKTSSPGVQQTNVLLHFSTAEPDPSLFRVPEGWNLLEGQPRERGVGSTRSGTSGAGARYNTVAGAHTSYDYVVQGVPYSAEEVTESGNRVTKSHVQSQPVKFYRDSSGRTRVERPLPNPYLDTRPSFVFPEITDPVDGLVIVLDPAHRIAHRFALGHMDPEPRSQFFSPVSVRGTVESRKDLGTDTLEGVLVSGELRTWRTPAGANGNDREYSESTEDWYSTKLKRVILEKYHGIESEAVVRLTHVSPEEPDPALFEVPAGYQIIDEKAPVEITVIQP